MILHNGLKRNRDDPSDVALPKIDLKV